MGDQSTITTMRKAYARWAPIYDIIYDKLTESGARAAVKAVEAGGPRILEVGVGTGLSLPYYAATSEVHGIDLSADMLKRAEAKVEKRGLSHVKSLQVMDACRLGFPDESFDGVTAQFLITLVPDPEGALSEMARVLRPGGSIVLINHLGASDGVVAKVEKAVAPLCNKIGWSSDFKLERLKAWASTVPGMSFGGVTPVFPGGFFKIVRFTKAARAA